MFFKLKVLTSRRMARPRQTQERDGYEQWWIFKIGGLRQNSNKGPRKIDVDVNNCNQTMPPSTTLQDRL